MVPDTPAQEPMSINMIEQKFLNQITGWLIDSSITYTQTDKTFNWKAVLAIVKDDERFYLDTGAEYTLDVVLVHPCMCNVAHVQYFRYTMVYTPIVNLFKSGKSSYI
jgi:hypothetical protein